MLRSCLIGNQTLVSQGDVEHLGHATTKLSDKTTARHALHMCTHKGHTGSGRPSAGLSHREHLVKDQSYVVFTEPFWLVRHCGARALHCLEHPQSVRKNGVAILRVIALRRSGWCSDDDKQLPAHNQFGWLEMLLDEDSKLALKVGATLAYRERIKHQLLLNSGKLR